MGGTMTRKTLRRTSRAIALALTVAMLGYLGAHGQEYVGSTVTVGDGTSGVDSGDTVVVAPGVTISGGEVFNETGIGVVSGGGSSIGAATGGGDNASLVE
jgi:hypothetical protein